jgi:hypothetical protein
MNKTIQINESLLCEMLLLLFSRLSPEEQYEWLQRNGSIICSLGIEDCIIEMHRVNSDVEFKRLIQDFWSPNEILTKEVDVETILRQIGDTCYENHLELSFNSGRDNMDLAISMAPFRANDQSRSYYSAPLFRAIINKYRMSDDDTFIFTKAIKGNDTFIVFNVKVNGNIIDLNVNITDNPTFLPRRKLVV